MGVAYIAKTGMDSHAANLSNMVSEISGQELHRNYNQSLSAYRVFQNVPSYQLRSYDSRLSISQPFLIVHFWIRACARNCIETTTNHFLLIGYRLFHDQWSQ
jgi:hypothetical protein